MQSASETHTPTTTDSPVPNAVHLFDSQYALRGAYIVLSVLGLCLLLALGVIAYLSHLLHRDFDWYSQSSGSIRSSFRSPLVGAGSRVGGSGVVRGAA